jgi:hypothetical protein
MHRTTRLPALLAAGLVLVAMGGAWAASAPTLTTPVQATKDDLNPGRTYSWPSTAGTPRTAA